MATENGGPGQKDVLGRSRIFTPEVINDIHIKSELGRYRMPHPTYGFSRGLRSIASPYA